MSLPVQTGTTCDSSFLPWCNMESYRVTDRYKNEYLCNIVREEGDYLNITIGGPYNSPCVSLVYSDEQFYIEGVSYHNDCSFNGLGKGQQGTQSMILTILCIAKHLFNNVSTFTLDDLSGVSLPNGHKFSLYLYYVVTRGYTWYQSFLTIRDKPVIEDLRKKLFMKITGTVQSVSQGYGIHPDIVRDALTHCTTESNWCDFHVALFTRHPDLKKDSIFNRIIDYHMYNRYHTEFKITENKIFTGFFKDVPCIQITLTKLPKFLPFSLETKRLIGGGTSHKPLWFYKSRHVFQSGEEDA